MGQNFYKEYLKFWSFLLVCSILICLLAFVMLFLWDISKWELDYKANIADILNVFVTVILAIIVSYFLAKKQSAEKFEKDLLISDLKEMEVKAKSIINLYEENTGVIYVTEVSEALNTLMASMERFKNTCILYYDNFSYEQLEKSSRTMYRSMTNIDGESVNLCDVNLAEYQSLCNDFIIQTRGCMREISRL